MAIAVFFAGGWTSQQSETSAVQRLRQHVTALCSEAFAGRATGTDGGEQAVHYILNQFRRLGLTPLIRNGASGSSAYLQRFQVAYRRVWHGTLQIGRRRVLDWYPSRYSGTDTGKAPLAILQCPGDSLIAAPGRALWVPDTCVRSRNLPFLLSEVKRLKPAIVLLPLSALQSFIDTLNWYPGSTFSFPVVFVPDALQDWKQFKAGTPVTFQLHATIQHRYGYNVVGMLPCNADSCSGRYLIVCAHLDHLGRGQVPGSRDTLPGRIHFGADDNASGVALLLELARTMGGRTHRRHHLVFIAFDGEELGLLGSRYFVEHSPIALERVLAVVNLDMVGRVDTLLQLLGTESSPAWQPLLDSVYRVVRPSFRIRTGGSGLGPSDHTSFYRKQIPVMHVFTGLHTDYHRPSDVPDRLNYSGMAEILEFLVQVLVALDTIDSLPFQAVAHPHGQGRRTPGFRVTLGIFPDYAYSGRGVRIDGVVRGKPAWRAGLKAGDIIIKMDDTEIDNIYTYMEVLSRFRPGDTVQVRVRRGDQELTVSVQF